MALIKAGGLDSIQVTGSVGSHTYRYQGRQLVVSQKAAIVTNPRTYEQMARRALWLNVTAVARHLTTASFKFAFEDKSQGQTDYNMFYKFALKHANPVYVTKQMSEKKLCVPVDYEVSRGSLGKVDLSYNASGTTFTSSLSAATISNTTTVAEFSLDLLAKNTVSGWRIGDKLAYVVLIGTMGDDGYLHFEVKGASVLLSADDTATLASVMPLLSVVNGKVAVTGSQYSCAAVIHVRPSTGKGVCVSSQSLVLSTDLITYASAYQTTTAKETAMNSLGGWNDSLLGSKASTRISDGNVVRDTSGSTSDSSSSSSSTNTSGSSDSGSSDSGSDNGGSSDPDNPYNNE